MPKNDAQSQAKQRVLDFIKDYGEWSNRFKLPQISSAEECLLESAEGLKSIVERLKSFDYDFEGETSQRALIAEKHWLDASKMSCPGSFPCYVGINQRQGQTVVLSHRLVRVWRF